MAEQMNEMQLMFQERKNAGTAWTRNEQFDKDGYLVIKDLWDPEELYHPVPEHTGQYNYSDKNPENFTLDIVEKQVEGSTSRYWHPQYRTIHTGIRLKLEKIIGRKLYNTYYYDRFYYTGQELTKHADRDACEISVSVHVSTNLEGEDAKWPFWIKTPDKYSNKKKTEIIAPGEARSAILEAGDGLLYKGCERPHWRNSMPTPRRRKRDILLRRPEKKYYYHQIFFHYVLADGERAHCAYDMSR
jgi:hypothetical protein|tara:strand:- start:51 stop:782 length:732 start_codon:yes stop_codon:yes gene_type:complete